MSALRSTFLLLLFASSLSAQLPDYFEFVDDWSGYDVLNVHPFQGGMIYTLVTDGQNWYDDGKVVHIKADGTFKELDTQMIRVEDVKFKSLSDSLIMFFSEGNFDCDVPFFDNIYTYDGETVAILETIGYQIGYSNFHPNKDSIYVFGQGIEVFSADGIKIREIERIFFLESFVEGFFYSPGNFYGIVTKDGNTESEIVDLQTGETVLGGIGHILDYAVFGNEMLVIADKVWVIDLEDFNVIRSVVRGDFPPVVRNRGRTITKVDDDYVFLSQFPDNTTAVNFWKPDGTVESVRSDKKLGMEFIHYDGSHFYTGHAGRIIRKSKELIRDYPYERTDIGIELLSAGEESTVGKLFLSVALTNNSPDTINKTTVWTSANAGPSDCGTSFFEFIVEKEILPGETITVDTSSFLSISGTNELTVSTYGADNLWDSDLSDNTDTDFVNSVSSLLVEDISYYPNPTADVLNLEFPTTETYEVEIWNPQGLIVEAVTLSGSDIYSLNIQAYPKGLYLIKIWSESDPQPPALVKVLKK